MKRLAVYDFDGTLMNSPEKEEGIPQWEKVRGEKYPYKGWWGRPESLDTNVFDIKSFPSILNQFNKDKGNPDTVVVILTSRMEKLRPQVENVLKLNGIEPDELILKKGAEDKGDIILRIENYNQDLKEINVYDDFAGGMQDKIAEYTKIKDKLSSDVQYNIYYVDNDRISLMESTNKILEIIQEEINNLI